MNSTCFLGEADDAAAAPPAKSTAAAARSSMAGAGHTAASSSQCQPFVFFSVKLRIFVYIKH
jgi:hypothetical protein